MHDLQKLSSVFADSPVSADNVRKTNCHDCQHCRHSWEKKTGDDVKRTTSPEIRATSQQHLQTIGNTQLLEKQMEFTSIGILLIDFLFFLC